MILNLYVLNKSLEAITYRKYRRIIYRRSGAGKRIFRKSRVNGRKVYSKSICNRRRYKERI